MPDLIGALIGLTFAVILLAVLAMRAAVRDRARSWIEDAEGLGLAHRFSSLAGVGSEVSGARGGRAITVRGPGDPSEAPFVRVHVGFVQPIPLGMELYRPPADRPLSVYRDQRELGHPEGTNGWALRAVQTDAADALVRALAAELAELRGVYDGARIHDGGVMLFCDRRVSSQELRDLVVAAEGLAETVEARWAAIAAERPAEPTSWPDLADRHGLEVDPDARRITGHLRGAFVEAKLLFESTELRVDIGEGVLDPWRWSREGGGEALPTGVERALRELPAGVREVVVVARWIEARCEPLDGASLGAALHRVLDARDALLGRADAYR